MFWACSNPRPNAYLGFKCYFPIVGIFLFVALILGIWICWIYVPGMISIYIFFHLFFVVYSYKQRICMEIFLYGFYKEKFHRSTCFLIEFCLLIIYFLFVLLSYHISTISSNMS